MYYSATGKAAIRQNRSSTFKKQLGQLNNKDETKEQLYSICDKIINLLLQGKLPEFEVKNQGVVTVNDLFAPGLQGPAQVKDGLARRFHFRTSA